MGFFAKRSAAGYGKIVKEQVPTLLVLLFLGAVGFWGYRTEWKAARFADLWGSTSAHKQDKADKEPEPSVKVTADASGPTAAERSCPLSGQRVEFSSAELVRKTGIRCVAVRNEALAHEVQAPGVIDYDQNHVARLASRVPGIAWKVEKDIGDRVSQGDVLALIEAPDVGKAKAEFLQAQVQFQLKTKTLQDLRGAETAVPARQIQEAEAALRDTRIRLLTAQQALNNLGLPVRLEAVSKLSDDQLVKEMRLLGLPAAVVRPLDPETATANLIPLVAPFDGVVTSRHVATGEVVDPSKILFTVADVNRIWILCDARQEDADALALGQPVVFRPDGHPDEMLEGKVSWISTALDDKTRTVRVRAVVTNPKAHLQVGTYGRAAVILRGKHAAPVVPNDALQREGKCWVVFVRLGATVFLAREVKPGVRTDAVTEIVTGVAPGEFVVSAGSHVLKAEILKGKLGGGE